MKRWKNAILSLALLAIAGAGLSCASPGGGGQGIGNGKRQMDERAEAALRRMSATIASAKSFTMHSMATVEQRMDSGQVVQFSRDTQVTMCKPGQLCADIKRGGETYRLWFDNGQLTVLDVRTGQYAQVQMPRKIGDMLDKLADDYGIVVPMDDLLQPDPYRSLVEHVQMGLYVGQADIGGTKCDHLRFIQENVDWQIWIETGEQAVPRRLVITYKDGEDRPQFEADMDRWQFDVPENVAIFKPQLPASAKKVELDDMADSN